MKNSETRFPAGEDPSVTPDEPFLRRWSKRKLENSTTAEERADAVVPQPASAYQPQQPGQVEPETVPSQKELTDEDMPPLETLDEHSDYSGFLSPKVSETLRRQALRKLFHFQQFNITDGLNDYDDDYTQFENLGNTITHEMKRLLERETQALREKEIDEEPEQGATPDDISHNKDNERNDTIVERNEITAAYNEENTETGNELI